MKDWVFGRRYMAEAGGEGGGGAGDAGGAGGAGGEGGAGGGEIVCTGTPEEVAENPKSYTGQYLKKYLLKNK